MPAHKKSERFQKDYRKTTAQHHQTSVNRNETGTLYGVEACCVNHMKNYRIVYEMETTRDNVDI